MHGLGRTGNPGDVVQTAVLRRTRHAGRPAAPWLPTRELFTKALAQGVEDVRRTVDVLASRPEVNPRQIGVMGVSLGGILAGTAAEQEPRISRAVLLLAGGDLLPIVHHARETRTLSETIHRLPPDQRAAVEAGDRPGRSLAAGGAHFASGPSRAACS